MRSTTAIGCFFLVGALAVVAPARAYEDEVGVGLAAGYGWSAAVLDVPRHGLGLSATAGVGLGDVFALQAHLGWSVHPGDAPMHVALGGVELVYLFDILEIVPFFGVGIDGVGSVVSGQGALELGLHGLLGFDWLVDWDWAVGLDVRVFVLPLAVDGARLDPVYGQVLVRATRRFAL